MTSAPPPPPGEPMDPQGQPQAPGQQPPPPSGQQPPPQPPPGYQAQPQQPPPGYPAQPAYRPPMSASEERTWAGAAHWSALVAALVGFAFLGPLLVMLTKGNDSPVVRRQAVESLNFQLTALIAFIVSFVLIFVLVGFLLLPVVGLMWLIFTIMGAVKASGGEDYRYPVNIRMVN